MPNQHTRRNSDQELINMLLAKIEEQREILRAAPAARATIKELNRAIARLGGEVEEDEEEDSRPSTRPWVPVIEPNGNGLYVCPECGAEGVEYTSPNGQGLGAHRRAKHGVKGSAKSA